MVSWGHRGRIQFLVELDVDGMQFYQQWNLLRLHGTAFCGEYISSKSDGELLFFLEMNFAIDITNQFSIMIVLNNHFISVLFSVDLP